MKKTLLFFIFVLLLASAYACKSADTEFNTDESSYNKNSIITVAVGIVPEAAFVKAVAGNLINVAALVPPGFSPANYQPTTMEMRALSDAALYFTLQMPAEQANILPKIDDFNKNIKIVDLRKSVSGFYPLLNTDGGEITPDAGVPVDPHIWLSPKRAAVMVKTIADELSAIDGKNKGIYLNNAKSYIEKLEILDKEIQEAVSSLQNKSFLIYHAAYGYFANDYGLKMIAIEIEGKQSTAMKLQEVIGYARKNNIKTVFYQEEFDKSQASTVAEELGGVVEKAAPLSADYIEGLRNFMSALVKSG